MENVVISFRVLEDSLNEPENKNFFKDNNLKTIKELESMSSEKLIDLLKKKDIFLDKDKILPFSKNHFYAKDLFNDLLKEKNTPFEESWDNEMIYLILCVLLKKINSNSPPIEFFDYFIYEGYSVADKDNIKAAISLWNEAMNLMIRIINGSSPSSTTFKELFENTYELDEWSLDFVELLIHSFDDQSLKNLQKNYKRIIDFFKDSQEYFLESLHLHYCQIFFYLKQQQQGDKAFQTHLKYRPKWKNGWLQWADNYSKNTLDIKDEKMAIRILEDALISVDSKDIVDVLLRLKQLYSSSNEFEKVTKINEQLEYLNNEKIIEDVSIDDIQDEKLREIIKKNNLKDKDIKDLL